MSFYLYLILLQKLQKFPIAAVDIRYHQHFSVIGQHTPTQKFMVLASKCRCFGKIAALEVHYTFDSLVLPQPHHSSPGFLDIHHRPAIHRSVLAILIIIAVIEKYRNHSVIVLLSQQKQILTKGLARPLGIHNDEFRADGEHHGRFQPLKQQIKSRFGSRQHGRMVFVEILSP